MSDVVNEVKAEAAKVVQEAKQLFAYEKAHVQVFLDYLAKRPYAEVMEIIEVMKKGQVLNVTPTSVAPSADPTPVNPTEPTDAA